MDKQGYHVFMFRVEGEWLRTTQIYDDTQFERLMAMLNWRLPLGMKVFHFNSIEPPQTDNPVFNARRVVEVDIQLLFTRRMGIRRKNAERSETLLSYADGFGIIEHESGYGRLLRCDYDNVQFSEYISLPFSMAKDFVNCHHRHCVAPQGHKFSIGLLRDGFLTGVIIASPPKARAHDDKFTLELNRCCVLPNQRNACSKLYGRAIATGRSMGYMRFITYTLPEESGSSVKAVGFRFDGMTQARKDGWNSASRPRKLPERYPVGQKCRWILNIYREDT